MKYTEVDFLIAPLEPWRDILMVELGELGYDSFEETVHGLKAYIPTEQFERTALRSLLSMRDPHVNVTHTVHDVPEVNWNAQWESSFRPVEVGRDVRIRAEFHAHEEGYGHEIVITPRMAFGTGHHATTRMMVQAMLGLDLEGKEVCDLGCGTAVLAILAEQRGAAHVLAVDIDQNAVINARENVELNTCAGITVEKGEVDLLEGRTYDAILANIERNVLVRDMEAMNAALKPGGALLLSGFIRQDRQLMLDAVVRAGMVPVEDMQEGEWALIGCRRP